MTKKQKINNDEKDLDYIAAAAYWENYANSARNTLRRREKKRIKS